MQKGGALRRARTDARQRRGWDTWREINTIGRWSNELGGFGERVEGRDGFDQASDGEGIENAAGFADEMQDAAFANQRNGHTNERGDAGAVNLRDAVEINDHFASAVFQNGVESGGELVTGIADGQASVDVENADAGFFANVDFDGGVLGHD